MYKRLIDLESIDGESGEIAQTGIACAEIVDRYLHSCCFKCVEDGFGGIGTPHQNAFGQLQLQITGVQSGFIESLEYDVAEVLVSKFHRGYVYGHGLEAEFCVEPGTRLTARFAKHPIIDGHDQSAIFGNGNELRRSDHASR